MIAEGIQLLLGKRLYSFSGVAYTETALLKKINEQTDVLLIDTDFPEGNGPELVRQLKKRYPLVKIIVINGAHDIPDHAKSYVEAGANGYIAKRMVRVPLDSAINTVMEGKKYLCEFGTIAIAESFVNLENEKEKRLSATELKIARLLSIEVKNSEIAAKLNISLRTVATHRKNIMKKIGAHNLAGIVLYAMKQGLLLKALFFNNLMPEWELVFQLSFVQ